MIWARMLHVRGKVPLALLRPQRVLKMAHEVAGDAQHQLAALLSAIQERAPIDAWLQGAHHELLSMHANEIENGDTAQALGPQGSQPRRLQTVQTYSTALHALQPTPTPTLSKSVCCLPSLLSAQPREVILAHLLALQPVAQVLVDFEHGPLRPLHIPPLVSSLFVGCESLQWKVVEVE